MYILFYFLWYLCFLGFQMFISFQAIYTILSFLYIDGGQMIHDTCLSQRPMISMCNNVTLYWYYSFEIDFSSQLTAQALPSVGYSSEKSILAIYINNIYLHYLIISVCFSGETPPYHYGTHYSSAMIVASYLVRMEPFTQHFLKLQVILCRNSIW